MNHFLPVSINPEQSVSDLALNHIRTLANGNGRVEYREARTRLCTMLHVDVQTSRALILGLGRSGKIRVGQKFLYLKEVRE